MKHTINKGEPWYEIHEIYKDGKKRGWTECGIKPLGESVKDLKSILKMILNDIKRNPVLDYKTGKIIKEKKKGL